MSFKRLNVGKISEISTLKRLRAHVTPIPKLNLPLLYTSDPVVQRPPDRPQSAITLRYIDVWVTLETDRTDSRHNDGCSDAERLEQAVF